MPSVPEEPEGRGPAASQRLDSWKAIAAYFQRNERTVRRWEQTEGLPVHRHLHEKRGTIYAYTAELDQWRCGRGATLNGRAPSPPTGNKRRLVWAAALVVGLAIAGAATWRLTGRDNAKFGGLQVKPLTSYPGNEKFASFSPDGSQVTFSWDGERQDNVDIYVKTLGVEGSRRLTSGPEEEVSPSWSPDGRWIAFLRLREGNAAVVIIPAAGGEERQLADIQKPPSLAVFGSHIGWAPTGDYLVVPDKGSPREPFSLVAIAPSNAEKRRLTSPRGPHGDLAAAISPDGRTLAFIRRTGFASSELFLMEVSRDGTPAGPERQITSFRRLTTSPAWFQNGRELLFMSGEYYSETSLWRIAASGSGEPELVAPLGDDDVLLAVSRQGRLTFTRNVADSNIWRIQVGGTEGNESKTAKTPIISSTRLDFNGRYSPDGKRLSFESNRSGNVAIWVCERDGSNPRQLTPLGGPRAWASRWSPDGRRLVFASGGLQIVDASGGSPRRLAIGDHQGGAPSWSLDGQWIYFQSNRSGEAQIWKISANGGEAAQVTQKGGLLALESIDRQYLYYTKGKTLGLASLWRTPVTGGEEIQIVDGLAGWDTFAVAAEGIYFIRMEEGVGKQAPVYGSVAFTAASIEFFDFSSAAIKKIAAIDRPVGVGLSVLPGLRGRVSELLYTQLDRHGSDLMLVERIR
jgi:Tol biopolymer transport system component